VLDCDEHLGHLFRYDCRVKCDRRGLEFDKCDVDEYGKHFCACG
jgi:hypothetical protein